MKTKLTDLIFLILILGSLLLPMCMLQGCTIYAYRGIEEQLEPYDLIEAIKIQAAKDYNCTNVRIMRKLWLWNSFTRDIEESFQLNVCGIIKFYSVRETVHGITFREQTNTDF